jgi:hypothetical protein
MTKLLIAGCLVLALLVGGVGWQKSVQSDKEDQAQSHTEVAALITSASADGVAASELLQEYVATGDETLIPQMQAKTDTGVRQLTTGISQAGGDPNGFVEQGATLVQATGEIIALRQSGDVQGAITAITALSEQFNAFIAAQSDFVSAQEAEAAAAQTDADSASDLATYFAIAAGILGIAVVGGAVVGLLRRSPQGESVEVAQPS